jgi:hypothetical protein
MTTAEQLWHDPDWTCPNPKCGAVNFAIREKCRICGYRVREIAQELDDEFGCDCGADDADWKRKNAGKMYNTESGHAIECPKFKIAEILRKFGLEP